jgi:hypothetical protein
MFPDEPDTEYRHIACEDGLVEVVQRPGESNWDAMLRDLGGTVVSIHGAGRDAISDMFQCTYRVTGTRFYLEAQFRAYE